MKNTENVKETATKMQDIYTNSPNDYYYLKGFIERIAQENKSKKLRKEVSW